jgi:hypothetical protein
MLSEILAIGFIVAEYDMALLENSMSGREYTCLPWRTMF